MACKIFLDFHNGLKMPALGYGTWQAKDEVLETALEAALTAGYRHIDTAFVYENEHAIGKVLKKWLSEGKIKRDDLFVTTKLPPIGMHADKVEEYLKKSLASLQLDYVDLYLIHSPLGANYKEETKTSEVDYTTNLEAIWKKMEEQVDAERTKSIGISNFTVKQIERILKICRIKPANLQIEVHAYMQQEELVNLCKKNAITVVAYTPLGNPSYNNFIKSLGHAQRELPYIMGDPLIKKLAEKHSKTPAQILLRHLLQRGLAAIPKSSTPSRIQENIDIFDFKLDSEDMRALASLEKGTSQRICDFKVMSTYLDHPEFPFEK